MNYKEYKNMYEKAKEFYDTIDFEQFFCGKQTITANVLQDILEQHYDIHHPELLPEDFKGYFFNFMNLDEFVDYLKERYNFSIREETVTTYYITR